MRYGKNHSAKKRQIYGLSCRIDGYVTIMNDTGHSSPERGAALIRRLVRTLPDTAGVYRMLDARGDVLYVGKAKSLRKRVRSYVAVDRLSHRIRKMVDETADMVFVHTHTEVEALLLETNLIKKFKPRFNVLMRDDKSFPYIFLSGDHDFPLLTRHRGAQKAKGSYYGPYASAGAVNRTITTLQKAFMLRNCTDSAFEKRTRPCLQYHIKRCTAPCVGFVGRDDYARQVRQAQDFLKGKSRHVQEELATAMQEASNRQDYELAAHYRDRIRALAAIQAQQDINIGHLGDADVIGMARQDGRCCVQVFFFRNGCNLGNRAYFPRHAADDSDAAILGAFIAQFYDSKPLPPEIILPLMPDDHDLLADALNSRPDIRRKTKLVVPRGGDRRRLVSFVSDNASEALAHEQARRAGEQKILQELADLFQMDTPPQRIEVYDNSHISGTNMVGAMIVAGPDGLQKNAWRKFNIRTAAKADDYDMMREVMRRRFGRALKEGRDQSDPSWPDLVLVDGGRGQLGAVRGVLCELGIADDLCLVAIAKGEDRHAGRETFHSHDRPAFDLPPDSAVLHYLQRLRDEAHRFAIGAHRARREKQISASPLDEIVGIGAKRKKALLSYFGSTDAIRNAGIRDLMAVDGVSEKNARQIYDHFHEN